VSNADSSIRAALELQLSNVVNLPQVAYENVPFNPTTGQSYIEVQHIPISRVPIVRGLNPQQRYDGLFRLLCYAPEGNGPSASQTMVDNVVNAFEATTSLNHNNITVSIDYVQRERGFLDSPWYFVPVTIGWYAYN
jgi:hypothetical protein